MIKTITIPTPRRIKRRVQEFNLKKSIVKCITKERVCIYTLIGTGIIIVSSNSTPAKAFIIGALIYHGVAFEILERWYDEFEDDEEFRKFMMESQVVYWQFPYHF